VDSTARFEALMALPDDEIPLDEAALMIAVHADPATDVEGALAMLDELAATSPGPTFEELRHHLFVAEGFRGDDGDYYDPANSMLDKVLARRRGIPITLSVIAIEVGRRLGVVIEGVGMPGHFLARHGGTVLDPFNGGADVGTVSTKAILARMLANLKQIYLNEGDALALEWVLRLRTAIPGVPDEDRHQLTRLRARWN
jgi:regulator of sirC expression with transglutaminase-like and TPR domain